MRKLIRRALKSLDRLDSGRLHALVQELVSDNEQIEMVLSSIAGAVLVMGLDDKITMINAPARRILPLSRQDPLELLAWEAITSRPLANYIQETLEEKRSGPRRDFSLQNRDRPIILNCVILPLVEKGRIRGNMLYAEDVTEYRAEESRRKRAEGLASLSTMAASMAHEIKNPLASMSIHLQLLHRHLKNTAIDSGELQESFAVLDEEIERLNAIVVDYMLAVRPQQSPAIASDWNALVSELIQFLRFEMKSAAVQVILLLDDNIPLVDLDERSMKQAILNLIKNALAAMPQGGKLRIQSRLEDNKVTLSISDTGEGISTKLQGKIFEPYFTTKDKGLGLGLTIVYKVIREHGGDLQVDSHRGEGSTFKISLPNPRARHKLLTGASP